MRSRRCSLQGVIQIAWLLFSLSVFSQATKLTDLQKEIQSLKAAAAAAKAAGRCDVRPHMRLGQIFFSMQVASYQYDEEALAAFRHVIVCQPHHSMAYYNIGALEMRRGNLEEAMMFFKAALSIAPRGPEANLVGHGLGTVHGLRANHTQAVATFRYALKINPADGHVYVSLSQALRAARQPATARRLATVAAALQPELPEAAYAEAMAARDMDDMEGAVAAMRRSSVMNPAWVDASTGLGVLLAQVATSRQLGEDATQLPWYNGVVGDAVVRLHGNGSEGLHCVHDEALQDGAVCSGNVSEAAVHLPQAAELWCCPAQHHTLQRMLTRLQYPTHCSPWAARVVEMPLYGFGSVMNYAVSALAEALQLQYTLVPARWSLPGYTSSARCGHERTAACFFASITNCTVDHAARIVPVRQEPFAGQMPHPFHPFGEFWYRSQLADYLWRLRPEVAQSVEGLKRAIGFKPPIIGMHIRGGDACSKRTKGSNRQCFALSDYMQHARRMRELYGIKRIFLATDDQAAVAATATVGEGFEWVIAPMDRQRYVSNELIEERLTRGSAADLDSGDEGATIINEVELLASADTFIGQFSGNVDRLAFQLLAARKGFLPPYVSLDIPWCSHWGVQRRIKGSYYYC